MAVLVTAEDECTEPEWGSLLAASGFSRTPGGAEAPRGLKPAPRLRWSKNQGFLNE